MKKKPTHLAAVEIFDPSGQRVIAALGSAEKATLDPWRSESASGLTTDGRS